MQYLNMLYIRGDSGGVLTALQSRNSAAELQNVLPSNATYILILLIFIPIPLGTLGSSSKIRVFILRSTILFQ